MQDTQDSKRWPFVVAGGLVLLIVATGAFASVIQSRVSSDEALHEHLMTLGAFATFTVVGALIIARRQRHVVGWILAAIGVLATTLNSIAAWGEYQLGLAEHPDVLGMIGLWANGWYWWLELFLILVFLPILFPDGRLPSRRWRPWVAIPVVSMAAMVLLGMFTPQLTGQGDPGLAIDNPIGIAGTPGVEEEASFLFMGLLFGLVLAVVAMVVRFRRSHGVERQQLKLFLLAVLVLPVLFVGDTLPQQWRSLADLVFPLAIAGLPVAIGVAVLRHRLYDIDRVISRTVSYALLTGVLVAVYALGVLGIGALLPGEPSDLLVAGSTLVVAALFQPLRSRIQALVDRRFNRARYDAARTVDVFASRLRDAVQVDALVDDLAATVQGAFGPSRLVIWTPAIVEPVESS